MSARPGRNSVPLPSPASEATGPDPSGVNALLARFPSPSNSDVIPMLQAVQESYGYLPRPVLEAIAARTRISATRIYGVATFYERFRFEPAGRHFVQTCQGTACHVNGARGVGRAVRETLGVEDHGTTADAAFTLETVACLGCCSLAPVMMVDETVYGNLSPSKAKRVLAGYREPGPGA
jgi:NADH-quinone oxidoreductase subunit E